LGYDVFETPREVLGAIKAAGYDGVDLPGVPGRLDPATMRPLLDDLGLEVPEIAGAWAFHHAGEDRNLASPEPEVRRRGVEYAKKCVDLAAEFGAPFFNVCGSQFPIPQLPFPDEPIPALRQNFIEGVAAIAEYAASRGITILLEPLNRYECCSGVLTTIDDALWVIGELHLDNVGIQPDVYHMNVAEVSIADAVRAGGKHIKLMHANETTRYRLGMGHSDYPALYATLTEIGFDGFMSVYSPLVSQALSALKTGDHGVPRTPDASALGARQKIQEVMGAELEFLKTSASKSKETSRQ
jgi:D-psicose/D-tagatose/L-ribulose 3-epimerase